MFTLITRVPTARERHIFLRIYGKNEKDFRGITPATLASYTLNSQTLQPIYLERGDLCYGQCTESFVTWLLDNKFIIYFLFSGIFLVLTDDIIPPLLRITLPYICCITARIRWTFLISPKRACLICSGLLLIGIDMAWELHKSSRWNFSQTVSFQRLKLRSQIPRDVSTNKLPASFFRRGYVFSVNFIVQCTYVSYERVL